MQLVHVESSIVKEPYLTSNYSYFVTTDPYLLSQFYDLLEVIYQKHYSAHFYVSEQEREFDLTYGKIIVALNERGQVIGGSRLIISNPVSPAVLPLEDSNLWLNSKLPHLSLTEKIYAEWGRYIVTDEDPNKTLVSANIAKLCLQVALDSGCSYLFFITKFALKVYLRRLFLKMNVPFEELLTSDDMPPHKVLKNNVYYLSMLNLTTINIEADNKSMLSLASIDLVNN